MKRYILFLFTLYFAHSHAQIITTIAGNGMVVGTGGDGGPATAASVWGPITSDINGNFYISASGDSGGSLHPVYWSKIRKINSSGIVSTFAGIDTVGFSGDGGPATAARLYDPSSLAFDKRGNLFIYDYRNYRIRKIDASGIITTYAGNGSSSLSGDGGPATAAGLGSGLGICIDTSNNVYVAAGGKIRIVDTSGVISTYAGTGTVLYNGDNISATAANFDTQGEIAIDQYGNLYLADDINNRIRKIAPGDTHGVGGIITTIAGNGTAGYSGDNGPATNAELYSPIGVYPDKCGNVYITDWRYNRVRVIDADGIIKVVAGNGYKGGTGLGGFSGDGGPATAAELWYPIDIYLDYTGGIYMNDQLNGRVRYIHMDSCVNTTATPQITKQTETLNIWPNPIVGGAFTFNLSSAVNEEINVSITNMVGEKVKELSAITNRDNEVKIDVPEGVYFISVVAGEGRLTKRIVVER